MRIQCPKKSREKAGRRWKNFIGPNIFWPSGQMCSGPGWHGYGWRSGGGPWAGLRRIKPWLHWVGGGRRGAPVGAELTLAERARSCAETASRRLAVLLGRRAAAANCRQAMWYLAVGTGREPSSHVCCTTLVSWRASLRLAPLPGFSAGETLGARATILVGCN